MKRANTDMTRTTTMDLKQSTFDKMDEVRSKLLQEGCGARALANKNIVEYLINSPLMEVIIREAVGNTRGK